MSDRERLEQLRQTCNGIRRIYNARQQVINDMEVEIEALSRDWRDLANSALNETDVTRRREIQHRQSAIIARRQFLRSEIQRLRERLEEYQNDFALNRCNAIVSPL